MSLFERYKKVCPNSIVKEGDISEFEMRQHIEHFEQRSQQSQENQVAPPSEEEKARYEEWKEGRALDSFFDFSEHQQMEIRSAVAKYEEKFGPLSTIHLSGSYASGSWFTWDTPSEEVEIRKAIKNCDHLSDIDLIPEPFGEALMIESVDFSKVPKGRKVKIYENGEFI